MNQNSSLGDKFIFTEPTTELGSFLEAESADSGSLGAARTIVNLLRSSAAGRSRVGFLSHPLYDESDWNSLAASLNCEVTFLPKFWLERLPKGAAFASISVAKLFDNLDEIAQSKGEFDVVFIAGLDLFLTRLDPDDCVRFWSDLHVRFPHRPRALILALPHSFDNFGPDLSKWDKTAARLS